MNYLLGITIGPVQTYIEESRKLLDLRNSSKIISDIMEKIFKLIKENAKSEFIYPNHKDISGVDYSNYMVIEIKDIEKMIDMKSIENKIYNCFNIPITNEKVEYKINIKENFYLFWGIEKIEEGKYVEAYEKLTRLIRSLKNTYEFEQNQQDSGEKCLICGKHNICTQNFNYKERQKYRLSVDEELCPLCLFKRKYSGEGISSIYSLAIKKWKEENRKELENITKSLGEVFKKEQQDKYYSKVTIESIIKMLSLDNVNKKSKKFIQVKDDLKNDELDLIKSVRIFKSIKEKMNKLYYDGKEVSEKIKCPSYEYCFIQFDIDNLGKWISGKYLEDRSQLKDYQQNISKKLIIFGKSLREALRDTCCDVIYSGGDDFLGILPNEDIINVAEIIDDLFKKEVQSKIKEEYKEINQEMTYSMSITIAQCKDPMSYALSKTRIELENVKKRYEEDNICKNGVSINYIINNGKEITCYLKKNKLRMLFELLKNFDSVKKHISFSYINNFENEMSKFNFNNITFEEIRDFRAIVSCEFKRLILRSKMIEDKSKDIKEKINKYIDEIINFLENVISENCIEMKSNEEYVDFKNIMNVLKINEKLSSIKFE
ncbi:Cas10/Cmr2 second palm domain-containing protein [Clostridium guangxiense]|uniref:Cas10/Cmr2 second palm domain-containing protein n=2 Tax=Clostridium TaxID=1485 RepID=UPI001E3B44C8|nr:type III-B CRISPR-associated protein Cas10/Cmr2 [Clostridium guangxiense]